LWYDKDLQIISVKLPLSVTCRIRGNRSEFVRQAVKEKLARSSAPAWQPKPPRRKLVKTKATVFGPGGELLDADGIAEELRQRRGGLD